ncbi:DUF4255 domain-containing protein [Actinokineospora auranticolor]|uniref:Uncharacterized protein DUF4255 n=1 Tax=Actinokineospora auranticolor TaxID=155976 RepID=A0A2S6GTM1_9PSEU|nr:DUF4255 domain-containing protein [Actinokineospora auranticolor]PPK68471.1 uncharacterized protein DUF4255 [Actinokineospora auranticolor]
MIDEVDEALRLLLAEEGIPAEGVELVFDAPTKDWAAKLTAPTVSVFLYDLREDSSRRRTGVQEEADDDGTVVGRREPPLWYQLSYLATVWTARPKDEHRLLSDILRAVAPHDVLHHRWLTGSLAELGRSVLFQSAGPITDGQAATEVWSALEGRLKPAVNLQVIAPLARKRTPVAPPVTDGLMVRTESDGDRRLRYDESAPSDGFAAARARPGARRRRSAR